MLSPPVPFEFVERHAFRKHHGIAHANQHARRVRRVITVIEAFIERYSNGWLLQRHGYLTPARAREKLSRGAA